MRYVAAYLLAVIGGNHSPDVTALKKILSSVGVDFDEKKAALVVDACKGKKVEDIMTKGMSKLASVPSGPAAGAAAPAAAGATDAGVAKESAAKASKKEEEEEEDEDMGFGLFD